MIVKSKKIFLFTAIPHNKEALCHTHSRNIIIYNFNGAKEN